VGPVAPHRQSVRARTARATLTVMFPRLPGRGAEVMRGGNADAGSDRYAVAVWWWGVPSVSPRPMVMYGAAAGTPCRDTGGPSPIAAPCPHGGTAEEVTQRVSGEGARPLSARRLPGWVLPGR
jgi:hypothetical protein